MDVYADSTHKLQKAGAIVRNLNPFISSFLYGVGMHLYSVSKSEDVKEYSKRHRPSSRTHNSQESLSLAMRIRQASNFLVGLAKDIEENPDTIEPLQLFLEMGEVIFKPEYSADHPAELLVALENHSQDEGFMKSINPSAWLRWTDRKFQKTLVWEMRKWVLLAGGLTKLNANEGLLSLAEQFVLPHMTMVQRLLNASTLGVKLFAGEMTPASLAEVTRGVVQQVVVEDATRNKVEEACERRILPFIEQRWMQYEGMIRDQKSRVQELGYAETTFVGKIMNAVAFLRATLPLAHQAIQERLGDLINPELTAKITTISSNVCQLVEGLLSGAVKPDMAEITQQPQIASIGRDAVSLVKPEYLEQVSDMFDQPDQVRSFLGTLGVKNPDQVVELGLRVREDHVRPLLGPSSSSGAASASI